MAKETEIELTYLASRIPENIETYRHTEIEDVYFPASDPHPRLRIRRQDGKYILTKKIQLDTADASIQQENSILLSEEEFNLLSRAGERRLVKTRYFMPHERFIAEIDIFRGSLKGLVLVEFEFESVESQRGFTQPDFCLADVTQDDFIAGGMLSGKTYTDIQPQLEVYGYKPLGI